MIQLEKLGLTLDLSAVVCMITYHSQTRMGGSENIYMYGCQNIYEEICNMLFRAHGITQTHISLLK